MAQIEIEKLNPPPKSQPFNSPHLFVLEYLLLVKILTKTFLQNWKKVCQGTLYYTCTKTYFNWIFCSGLTLCLPSRWQENLVQNLSEEMTGNYKQSSPLLSNPFQPELWSSSPESPQELFLFHSLFQCWVPGSHWWLWCLLLEFLVRPF